MDTHTLASVNIRTHHQRTEHVNRSAWMLDAPRAEKSSARDWTRRLAEAREILRALVAPRSAQLDPTTTRR